MNKGRKPSDSNAVIKAQGWTPVTPFTLQVTPSVISDTPKKASSPFLEGKCYDFALALHEIMPNAEFVVIGSKDENQNFDFAGYNHVGLRQGDRYFDARGEMDEKSFRAHHQGHIYVVSDEDVIARHAGLNANDKPYQGKDITAARKAVQQVFPHTKKLAASNTLVEAREVRPGDKLLGGKPFTVKRVLREGDEIVLMGKDMDQRRFGLDDMVTVRTASSKTAAPAHDDAKAQTFYHGTSSEKSAQDILRNGIQPRTITMPDKIKSRAQLAPVPDRVYLTTNLQYAGIYALGGSMFNAGVDSAGRFLKDADPYGYIFEVPGSSLSGDLTPDEDSIGEAVCYLVEYTDTMKRINAIKAGKPEAYKGQLDYFENKVRYFDARYLDGMDASVRWELLGLYEKYATPRMREHFDEVAYQAQFGKKVQKHLTTSTSQWMIDHGAHVAHQGAVHPSKCWRFSKEKALVTPKANIQSILEPVPVTSPKTASAKTVRAYHGTTADFDTFEVPAMFHIKKSYCEFLIGGLPNGHIIEAILTINNPADLHEMHISPSDPDFKAIAKQLEAEGYDGAQYRNEVWIAFKPEQIRVVQGKTASSGFHPVSIDSLPKPTKDDIAYIIHSDVECIQRAGYDEEDVYNNLLGLEDSPKVLLGSLPVESLYTTMSNRSVNDFAAKKYTDMLLENPSFEFDPIIVVDGKHIEGGHRMEAYHRAGRTTIPVVDIANLIHADPEMWYQWMNGENVTAAQAFPIKTASKYPTPEGITFKVTGGVRYGFLIRAWLEDENIGRLLMKPYNHVHNAGDQIAFFVGDVEVLEEFRERGIGLLLYKEAIRIAKDKGAIALYQGIPQTDAAATIWSRLAQEYDVKTNPEGSKFIRLAKFKTASNIRYKESKEGSVFRIEAWDGLLRVGQISSRIDSANPKNLKITMVIVDKPYRKRGIATTLYQHLFDLAKNEGFEAIYSDHALKPGAKAIWKKIKEDVVKLYGLSTTKTAATENLQDLEAYLKMPERQQWIVYAETFLEDWIDFNEDDPIAPEEATPESLREFWEKTHRIMMYEQPENCPAFMFMTYEKTVRNAWVAHFSRHAEAIAQQGLTRGVEDINRLGLTTQMGEDKKGSGGFNFGFLLDAKTCKSLDENWMTAVEGYGDGLVLAKVDAVVVYHETDRHEQAIFFGRDAKEIVLVDTHAEGGWGIRGKVVPTFADVLSVAKNKTVKVSSAQLFHVTETKNVPNIKAKGLTRFNPSNWETGDGERYGESEIYAFENKWDAIRWAARMDWSLNKKTGSGKISIVVFKKGKEAWEEDTNDPLSHMMSKGHWLKTMSPIPPAQIVGAFPVRVQEVQELMENQKFGSQQDAPFPEDYKINWLDRKTCENYARQYNGWSENAKVISIENEMLSVNSLHWNQTGDLTSQRFRKEAEVLAKEIVANKYFDAIALDQYGFIVDGHHRAMAAEILGFNEIPCTRMYLEEGDENNEDGHYASKTDSSANRSVTASTNSGVPSYEEFLSSNGGIKALVDGEYGDWASCLTPIKTAATNDPILRCIREAQKKFGKSSLSGGNCGMLALYLASKFPELRIGVIYKKDEEGWNTPAEILSAETDIYHVFCHLSPLTATNCYDGAGLMNVDKTYQWIADEYGDGDPGDLTDISATDPACISLVENDTDWSISLGEFTYMLSSKTAASIDSHAFESWFAGSKVVDKRGKPLKVYHGTKHTFEEFNTETYLAENGTRLLKTNAAIKRKVKTAAGYTGQYALYIEVPEYARAHFYDPVPAHNYEFWAFKHRPRALRGEKIVFTFDGNPVAESSVAFIESPGRSSCSQTGKYERHHKVFWNPKDFKKYKTKGS